MASHRVAPALALIVFAALVFDCGQPPSERVGRPTDGTFLRWLDAEEVTVSTVPLVGWRLRTWTIDKSDVAQLRVEEISEAPAGVYTARLKFTLLRADRALAVKGLCRYHRDETEPGKLVFDRFVATDTVKLGNW